MINPQRIQYIADPDKLVITPTLRKDLLKGWTSKMVNKVKDSSVYQWMAPILLTVLLGYTIYDKQTQSVQIRDLHDEVLKLQVRKEEQDKATERDRQERFQLSREDAVWREQISKQMGRWELVIQGKYPKNGNNSEKEN